MAHLCSASPWADFGQRSPPSAPAQHAEHLLAPRVPLTQHADCSDSNSATSQCREVMQQYKNIFPTPTNQIYLQRVNAELAAAGIDLSSVKFSITHFADCIALWSNVVVKVTVNLVDSITARPVQDYHRPPELSSFNPEISHFDNLIAARKEGEIWFDRTVQPLNTLYPSCPWVGHHLNGLYIFRALMSGFEDTLHILYGPVAKSIMAIARTESPPSYSSAKEVYTDRSRETIHQYTMKCEQMCNLATNNLRKFEQYVNSLINIFGEWTAFAGQHSALYHVRGAHSHVQMNQVLQKTVEWIRGLKLTTQALSIAHSTAGQIACDLVNCQHSTGAGIDATSAPRDTSVGGQEYFQANSFNALRPPLSCSGASGFGSLSGATLPKQNTGPPRSIEMETFYEINMADVLTGNGLKNPGEAAFDTSRNVRKLGENSKPMKAVVRFNDKLGQLQKTRQVNVWTTTDKVNMSRPRKQLLSAIARAILTGIGVTKDKRVTGLPEERYIFMASGEAFDLKSVFFRSAQLLPCLKVIDVKVDWSDGA